MLKINAGAYSFEAGNVRHEHEWAVWKDTKLPDDKLILPGVVSHATNVVEHPELVAERIGRFARLVGRERVIASTDCGLGGRVHPRDRLGQARDAGPGRGDRQQAVVVVVFQTARSRGERDVPRPLRLRTRTRRRAPSAGTRRGWPDAHREAFLMAVPCVVTLDFAGGSGHRWTVGHFGTSHA